MQEESVRTLAERADALIEDHEKMMRELTALRRQAGLTQQEVAERMGVSQPCVSQLERYDANPTLDTVRRYAMAVGARIVTHVLDDKMPCLKAQESVVVTRSSEVGSLPEVAWNAPQIRVPVVS